MIRAPPFPPVEDPAILCATLVGLRKCEEVPLFSLEGVLDESRV